MLLFARVCLYDFKILLIYNIECLIYCLNCNSVTIKNIHGKLTLKSSIIVMCFKIKFGFIFK